MSYITYTASRRIISGHSAGTSYSLTFLCSALDPADNIVGGESVALDGTTEGTLDRVEELWAVTTLEIEQADLAAWREFFASVAAKETFTFDAYAASPGAPDNPQTAILVSSPTYQRVETLYKLKISFNLRVIS